MSNEIKNTLFRFVSMRAPELTTEKEKNKGFILQPKTAHGVFNQAIAENTSLSKLACLKNTASTFSPLTLEQIKEMNPALYELSVWIAKNRFSVKEKEALQKVDEFIEKNGLATLRDDSAVVWQNLYYQVITQKDFYAKETLMQLLLASHVVENYKTSNILELLKAKVILPKELFIEDTANQTGSAARLATDASYETPFASPEMQRLELKSTLEAENTSYAKLQKELVRIEERYKKEYDAEYQKQYDAYQVEIKPLLDAYNAKVEEAKQAWCSVKDPNVAYNPNDPCQQPPSIPLPELPKFSFTFRDELDPVFLRSHLSAESFEVYNALLNPVSDDKDSVARSSESALARESFISASNTTFDRLQNSISDLVNTNNQTISQNTPSGGTTTVVVGGTTIQTTNNQSNLAPFEFEIKSKKTIFSNRRTLTLMVGIPSAAWKIASIRYKMTRLDGSVVEYNNNAVSHYAGYDVFKNLSLTGITADLKEFSATVQFQNGKLKTLTIPNYRLTAVYRNFLNDLKLELEDSSTTTTGSNSTINPDERFIPSGFGVKRLGIADYNKVEQTIHGYIEGEVAHIENIMAREFKEKSTRRLRKSEITETSSTETEREQLTDTTTTDRFEMQSEVAKVIANSKDFSGGVGVHYGSDKSYKIDANANFATHNSKEESTRQAMTAAKEVTERALDRIVSKVKEERIEKIVEEFEENNTHGFDNRKGDKHVVGVYRWVDKIFKNQIINYGKRLMFEFMVPQPAKLHTLAMKTLQEKHNAMTLEMPVDPRTVSGSNSLENYSKVNEATLQYWTKFYNIEVPEKPSDIISVSHSFNQTNLGIDDGNYGRWTGTFSNDEFKVPNNYSAIQVNGVLSFGGLHGNNTNGRFFVCGTEIGHRSGPQVNMNVSLGLSNKKITDKITITGNFWDVKAVSGTLVAKCELSPEAKAKWQQATFKAIINAYEEALDKYNETLAQKQAEGVQILGTNPGFYREIENTILRKNCISYLISSNPLAKRTFGRGFYTKNNTESGDPTFENAMIKQDAELDDYAAFVKFMEQAFEWNIMSYNFYPYYWAKREDWIDMYQYNDTHDHIFKAFMQSGMARVIVTVRPGFEDAVNYYMQTGQIWNGGEVPVIDDELYVSIVDELRAPEGEKVGLAWPTRVPTSMTILQAQSIGLKVTKALPSNDGDLDSFENPDEVPQSSQIELNQAEIGISEEEGVRHIENIDINNGYLQLTTDESPRQIVAQISLQAIKNAIDEETV